MERLEFVLNVSLILMKTKRTITIDNYIKVKCHNATSHLTQSEAQARSRGSRAAISLIT